MSCKLPQMNKDAITRKNITAFKGYDHNLGSGDGTIYDMKNLVSDYYPLLSPRGPRYLSVSITKPNGLYAHGDLYYVDGTTLYKNGTSILTGLTDSEKILCAINTRIVVWPDKKYYQYSDGEATTGSLESEWSGTKVWFKNGTYDGSAAECNTIECEGVTWSNYFKVGDAVTISGSKHSQNNKTPIVREIEDNQLRFYENCFVLDGENGNEDYEEPGEITIKRTVPDLDFIIENDNRLFGLSNADNTIYACKLGDPFNWNVFDGLSTDSYALQVGSPEKFTGAVSYLGYPIFFKADHIYKLYGDYPSNYQLIASATLGVMEGADKSLAIANEILYYMSKAGIMSYSGGIPQLISYAFGTDKYKNGVAGTDGRKYYCSMQNCSDDTWALFCYDPARGMWHKEDSTQATGMGYTDELYILDSSGNLWLNYNARTPGDTTEETITSEAIFGDFVYGAISTSSKYAYMQDKKHVTKLQLRAEIDADSTLEVSIQYDSDGTWHSMSTITAAEKRSYVLPVVPRRCDHFSIKLTGTGNYKLYTLTLCTSIGSRLKDAEGRQ